MKRDMDLIRRIALEVEAMPVRHHMPSLEGIDNETFATHVAWMKEAGLLIANISEYLGDDPPSVSVIRLTWAGCEFLEAARNETAWKKVRKMVVTSGRSITFDVLKELLKTEITQGFPTLKAMS